MARERSFLAWERNYFVRIPGFLAPVAAFLPWELLAGGKKLSSRAKNSHARAKKLRSQAKKLSSRAKKLLSHVIIFSAGGKKLAAGGKILPILTSFRCEKGFFWLFFGIMHMEHTSYLSLRND